MGELDDLGPIARVMCERLATEALDLTTRREAGEVPDNEFYIELVGIVRESHEIAITKLEIQLDYLYELTGHERPRL